MLNTQERGKGKCRKFAIELRQRGDTSCVYMFSFHDKPFGQAEIANQSVEKLRRLPEQFSGLGIRKREDPNKSVKRESSIRDLKFGLKGVSFKAHVVKKSDVRCNFKGRESASGMFRHAFRWNGRDSSGNLE